MDEGCCHREKVCARLKSWKPHVVQRLETPKNLLLHGLHTFGLGYPLWPCWLRLGLVSPALSLDSWSRATTSELTTSSADECARKRGVTCRKCCS